MGTLLMVLLSFAGGFVTAKSVKKCPKTGWAVCLCWLTNMLKGKANG